MIEWRIREGGHGGYIAEKIGIPEKGIEAEYKSGVYVGVIMYESANFETSKEAEKYIKRRM